MNKYYELIIKYVIENFFVNKINEKKYESIEIKISMDFIFN